MAYSMSPISLISRGMNSLEAETEYVRVVQKMEGYGDEYYPVKVSD